MKKYDNCEEYIILDDSLDLPLQLLRSIDTMSCDNNTELQIKGSSFPQVFEYLLKHNKYLECGKTSFPSKHAIVGSLYYFQSLLSHVIPTKEGEYNIFSCKKAIMQQNIHKNNKNNLLYDDCGEHILLMHESMNYKQNEKVLSDLKWKSYWVAGGFACGVLDFDSFFTGQKEFDKKQYYYGWIKDKKAIEEIDRIKQCMGEELIEKVLLQIKLQPDDSLADIMYDIVSQHYSYQSIYPSPTGLWFSTPQGRRRTILYAQDTNMKLQALIYYCL